MKKSIPVYVLMGALALGACAREPPRSPAYHTPQPAIVAQEQPDIKLEPKIAETKVQTPEVPKGPKNQHLRKQLEDLEYFPKKELTKLLDQNDYSSCKELVTCPTTQMDYLQSSKNIQRGAERFDETFGLKNATGEALDFMADNFKGEDSMVALHPIIPEGERKKDLTSRLNEISSGYILDFNADLGLTQPGAPELEKVQEMVLARYKSSELVNKEVDDRDYNVIQPLDGSLDKIYKTSIAAPQEERAKWGKLLTLVNSPSQIEEAGATFGEEEKTALYTSAANFHLAIAEMAFDCAGECPTPKYEHLQTALEFYQALGIQGQEGYTTVKALQKVNAVELEKKWEILQERLQQDRENKEE